MIGSWITLSDPSVSEILAGFPEVFNFLVVDRQHSNMTDQDMANHIRNIDPMGVLPFVRVRRNTVDNVGMALDAGARGIIVPNVETLEDVRKAIGYMRYGSYRSAGLWRSWDYGRETEELGPPPRLLIQIENRLAADQVALFNRMAGVDGWMIGAYDLSASLGTAGDFESPLFQSYLQELEKYAKTSASGIHIPIPSYLQFRRAREIYKYVAIGMDTTWLWQNIENFKDVL